MAVINVESSNFEKEVMRSKQPVLLDFFATWCLPCKMLPSGNMLPYLQDAFYRRSCLRYWSM